MMIVLMALGLMLMILEESRVLQSPSADGRLVYNNGRYAVDYKYFIRN
jgi:hypothetical protein